MDNDFDINDFIIDDDRSWFEEALIDCIREWQGSGKDPEANPKLLKEYALELLANALQPIPCWKKQAIIQENGLFKVRNGTALVYNGYFVMLEDLVENLPREIE